MAERNMTPGETKTFPESPERKEAAARCWRGGEDLIDFHAPEFNRVDDLNDSYPACDFESLEGVVTADMRHQEERFKNVPDDLLPCREDADDAVDSDENGFEERPPVILVSEGKTLIIDTNPGRAARCREILTARQLKCTSIITGMAGDAPADKSGSNRHPPAIRADAVSVTGAFCGFSTAVTVNGKQKHRARWFDKKQKVFDLVLDLQPIPSYTGGPPPVGYFTPRPDDAEIDDALSRLPLMRGRFTKPRFAFLREKYCLRGLSRNRDCLRCIDICPVGAIQPDTRKVTFNHHLCQGCGACALSCPMDAIDLVRPGERCLTNELHEILGNRGTGRSSHLVISDTEIFPGSEPSELERRKGGDHIRFRVDEASDIRTGLLLAAFCFGAEDVLVAIDPRNSRSVEEALEHQIRMTRAVLSGIGLPGDAVRMIKKDDADKPSVSAEMPFTRPPLSAGSFTSIQDRRAWIRLAVQYLYDRRGSRNPEIRLPAESSFGGIDVDTSVCTLCMACVSACPFDALSSAADAPRLSFCEASCRQCGLCAKTCPEHAIRLSPRFLCDPDRVYAQRVLHETEVFRCLECGAPFASSSMIASLRDKLKGHWMYANEHQIRRLSLCGTCRTRDALLSEEVTKWMQR